MKVIITYIIEDFVLYFLPYFFSQQIKIMARLYILRHQQTAAEIKTSPTVLNISLS
jgi:hypothetical protein